MVNLISLAVNTLFLYLIILNFFLAFFVIFRNPKKHLNQSFSLLCLSLASWLFSLYASQHFKLNSVLFLKLGFFTHLVIILDCWFISFVFPKKIKALKSAALIFGTAYFISLSTLLFFTSLWVDKNGSFGRGFLLFFSISWLPISWTIFNLYHQLGQTAGLAKTQLKYFFFGFIFWSLTANFFTALFNVSGNDLAYFAFSGLSSLILSSAVFYAIARYRLLDIKFLLSKAIVYSLLAIIMIISYTIVLFIIGLYFYQAQLSNINLFITLSLVILLTLTISPLKKGLEKITNRTILKDKILQHQALAEFSSLFFSASNLPKLASNFCQKLQQILHLENAFFVLRKNNQIYFFPQQEKSLKPKLKELQPLLSHQNQVWLLDDLKEGKIKNLFRRLKAYYCFCQTSKNYAAFVFLGYKKNGDLFFEDEINYLKVLLPQFFISLEKVLIYEKIKEFNHFLKQKVIQATNNLKKTNKNLTQTLRLKNEVISIIAHELSVPMIAIAGSLETVLEGLTGKLPAKSQEFLQAIYNENARLIRLTKNLLSLSRIKSGRLKFQIEKFNPQEVLKQAVEMMQPLALEKKLLLTTDINNNKLKVEADRDKLKEVLINLIDNSIRYTKKGKITVGWLPEKNKIKFFIKDTGKGISFKNQNQLFEKVSFLTGKNQLEKKSRGLGLYICQNLLKGMKGKITLKSQPKKGTTVSFWLKKA